MQQEDPSPPAKDLPEPWLRAMNISRYSGLPVVQRAVLDALELAREDLFRWCAGLDDAEMHARPFHLPSAAFQLRHIARSLDRFFTYARGGMLSASQLAALAAEMDPQGSREEVFDEFSRGLEHAEQRLRETAGQPLELPVRIGRRGLPTTLGGLLVHAAEHTQRHVGQAITTSIVVLAQRPGVEDRAQGSEKPGWAG